MKFYKILNKEMCHHGFQYKEGLNVDTKEFVDRPCCGGGLFFSDAKHILHFCEYGDLIADVNVPEGETIISLHDKFKAHQIMLSNIRPLYSLDVFEELEQETKGQIFYNCSVFENILKSKNKKLIQKIIVNGVFIDHNNYGFAFCKNYMIKEGMFSLFKEIFDKIHISLYDIRDSLLSIIKYDQMSMLRWMNEHSDIHVYSDYAFNFAVRSNKQNFINFFLKNNSKVSIETIESTIYAKNFKNFKKFYKMYEDQGNEICTTDLNAWLKDAIHLNLLDIVKFLHKKGADILTVQKKHGICIANKSLELTQYLLDNGLDVHYRDDVYLMITVEKDNLKRIELLLKYGANPKARRGWIKRKASPEALTLLNSH